MRFVSLHLRDGLEEGSFDFEDKTVVVSSHNQAGKTTLLRALLFALGYPIPSTRGIRFENLECSLTIAKDDGEIVTINRRKNITEASSGTWKQRYSLPIDQNELHKVVFGIDNPLILDNLLGSFYLDQEKGWTLLNRGKVIGRIQFTIEDFMRGMSDRPCEEERQQLTHIEQELKKCQQLIGIAQYREEFDLTEAKPYETPIEQALIEVTRLKNQRLPLVNELHRLEGVLRQNTKFKKFIGAMRLRVRDKDGDMIPVNEDTIVGFRENDMLLQAKCRELQIEISELDNKLGRLSGRLSVQDQLVTVKSSIEEYDTELSRISIDRLAVESIVRGLKRRQATLKETIKRAIAAENKAEMEMFRSVTSYLRDFGIDERYGRDIYTHDLKSLTGASFHLLVFAFRMSYIKLVRQKTGIVLPFVIDSPSGREVELRYVKQMMDVLQRDFADHQLIIATIYDPKLGGESRIVLEQKILKMAPVATGNA